MGFVELVSLCCIVMRQVHKVAMLIIKHFLQHKFCGYCRRRFVGSMDAYLFSPRAAFTKKHYE